jgi:transaldolase
VQSGAAKKEDQEIFLGKTGIENCQRAYSVFLKEFAGARFDKLKERGAKVQRPLWASTGVKNRAFDPLLYVEQLVDANTVNTLPPQTLGELMAADRAWQSRLKGAPSDGAIGQLSRLGLNLEGLLTELEHQGVELFAESYRQLLAAIESKAGALRPAAN